MNKNRNALLAGLFMLCSIALMIGVVIAVRGWSMEKLVTRSVKFTLADNISGLRAGDDVRIGGHRVGVIKSVQLEKNDDGTRHILVKFTVPQSADIRRDAHIAIESNVTGTADLNIDNFGAGNLLADNDVLVGSPSPLIAIIDAAKQLAPNLNGAVSDVRQQTLPRFNETIDKVKAQVDPTATKYQALADRGNEALINIRDLFGDTKTDFRTTVANLAASTTAIKEKIGGILEKVDNAMAKIGPSLDSASAALEDIKTTAANVKDISNSSRSIVVNNRSKIDGMITSLKTTGDNLKAASAEIRRSPWRLLYKPTSGEVANLNIYDTARQFAEGANDLNDAASALRDSIKDPNLSQADLKTLIEKLDKSFAKFNEVESQLWKEVRE